MSNSLGMRIPALATAAVALVVLAHPSSAATKRFHIADPVGDANGVNGQGIGPGVPSRSTAPADLAGADITGIDLVNRFKGVGRARKPSGFDVTLRLAAPLQTGTVITVTMDTSVPCGGSSRIQLGAGTSSLAICQSSKTGSAGATIGTTEVSPDRKSITWSIDNLFRSGTRISGFYASSSVFVLGVFDEAASDATFTYGT
jgi:hypothetical protein